MKIACNYYKETIELLREGRITLDYVKVPALGFQYDCYKAPGADKAAGLAELKKEIQRIQEVVPVLLHGFGPQDYNMASDRFRPEFDKELAAQIIGITKTPELSGHLALGNRMKQELYTRERIKELAVENIRFIRELFPEISHLAIENMDGNPFIFGKKAGCCIEPAFIREVTEESGAEFLLDVSHAYGSALYLGIDFKEYLDRLPMDQLYEIHINGWINGRNDLMSHVAMSEDTYTILEMILDKYKTPEILTIEYGRMDDRMAAGIPLMGPDGGNERAKGEIEEQVRRVFQIMEGY
ncbi:DUF692 family multinuclear iron-containing protein [[Clostridium] symbiosum]|uniref:multinuclear nonheme iron-dependent oxidase n=1 Tax=Clostridium symbiosum TaxID=1512 RepID=UPI001D097898|nr:DUF692 family multinuclear iron-containing protein [[Clostridium] symbiosum]MCB6610832.1 DUF692 family protein [[Clostridium] symbiosum]MCB6929072.1 DUF692 family protein [[Clostridium] symbiosum]